MMLRALRWIVCLIVLLQSVVVLAQTESTGRASGLQVSIITCGPGTDLYSVYGHSAVRIVDSMRGTDKVYNYGTFDFSDPDFYWKFTRGKLLYYLNVESYDGFVRMYQREGRSVYEQVLNLPMTDAVRVQDFLETNLLPENKYYHYDFLFDNCSTRIRDIFPSLLGARFSYGRAMANDSLSFRQLLDAYERNIHWERVGINLLLSSRVDDKMNSNESMFLPDFLQKGFHGATLDGQALVKQTLQVAPSMLPFQGSGNGPRQWLWTVLIAVFLLSIIPRTRFLMVFIDVLLFLVIGLLGCFLVFMWFGTEHAVCAFNLNLFWAFPLHVLLAYFISREHNKKAAYARVASSMLVVGIVLSWLGPQPFSTELTPLLLLLYWRLSVHSRMFNLQSFGAWNTAR
jgi:hypothetical protein